MKTAAPPAALHDRLSWWALPLCIALFVAFPQLDLTVARHLHTPGGGFTWAREPFVRWIYVWTPWIGRALLLVLAGVALAGYLKPPRVSVAWRRMAVVALCVAVIGPGLVIECGLKPYWQRPRPVQLQEFGGHQRYYAPFEYCEECTHHHSFVTSHAASGFFLMALGLTAEPVQRRRWYVAGMLAGVVIGLCRMAQGGHFLSDVVFAYFAVWLSGRLVMAVLRRRGRPPAGAG